jgi:hypothetical protein
VSFKGLQSPHGLIGAPGAQLGQRGGLAGDRLLGAEFGEGFMDGEESTFRTEGNVLLKKGEGTDAPRA